MPRLARGDAYWRLPSPTGAAPQGGMSNGSGSRGRASLDLLHAGVAVPSVTPEQVEPNGQLEDPSPRRESVANRFGTGRAGCPTRLLDPGAAAGSSLSGIPPPPSGDENMATNASAASKLLRLNTTAKREILQVIQVMTARRYIRQFRCERKPATRTRSVAAFSTLTVLLFVVSHAEMYGGRFFFNVGSWDSARPLLSPQVVAVMLPLGSLLLLSTTQSALGLHASLIVSWLFAVAAVVSFVIRIQYAAFFPQASPHPFCGFELAQGSATTKMPYRNVLSGTPPARISEPTNPVTSPVASAVSASRRHLQLSINDSTEAAMSHKSRHPGLMTSEVVQPGRSSAASPQSLRRQMQSLGGNAPDPLPNHGDLSLMLPSFSKPFGETPGVPPLQQTYCTTSGVKASSNNVVSTGSKIGQNRMLVNSAQAEMTANVLGSMFWVFTILQLVIVVAAVVATHLLPLLMRKHYLPLVSTWKVIVADLLPIIVPLPPSKYSPCSRDNPQAVFHEETMGYFIRAETIGQVERLCSALCCVPYCRKACRRVRKFFKARLRGHSCYYLGEVDCNGRPHGFGRWCEECEFGESLVGYWNKGIPVGPFKSQVFGTGCLFSSVRVAFCDVEDLLLPDRQTIAVDWGISDIESSVSGLLFRGFPQVKTRQLVSWQAPTSEATSVAARSTTSVDRTTVAKHPTSMLIHNHDSEFGVEPGGTSDTDYSSTQQLEAQKFPARILPAQEDPDDTNHRTVRQAVDSTLHELNSYGHVPVFGVQGLSSVEQPNFDLYDAMEVGTGQCHSRIGTTANQRDSAFLLRTEISRACNSPVRRGSGPNKMVSGSPPLSQRLDSSVVDRTGLQARELTQEGKSTGSGTGHEGTSKSSRDATACSTTGAAAHPKLSCLPHQESSQLVSFAEKTSQFAPGGFVVASEVVIFIHHGRCGLPGALKNFGYFVALCQLHPRIKPLVFGWQRVARCQGLMPCWERKNNECSSHDSAVEALLQLLNSLRDTGISNVHFVAQGTGCQVLLTAIFRAVRQQVLVKCSEMSKSIIGLTTSTNTTPNASPVLSRWRTPDAASSQSRQTPNAGTNPEILSSPRPQQEEQQPCCTQIQLLTCTLVAPGFNLTRRRLDLLAELRLHCPVVSIYCNREDSVGCWYLSLDKCLNGRCAGRAAFGFRRRDSNLYYGFNRTITSGKPQSMIEISGRGNGAAVVEPVETLTVPRSGLYATPAQFPVESCFQKFARKFHKPYRSDPVSETKYNISSTTAPVAGATTAGGEEPRRTSGAIVVDEYNGRCQTQKVVVASTSALLEPLEQRGPTNRVALQPVISNSSSTGGFATSGPGRWFGMDILAVVSGGLDPTLQRPNGWLDIDVIDTTSVAGAVTAGKASWLSLNREVLSDIAELMTRRSRARYRSNRLSHRIGNVWTFSAAVTVDPSGSGIC